MIKKNISFQTKDAQFLVFENVSRHFLSLIKISEQPSLLEKFDKWIFELLFVGGGRKPYAFSGILHFIDALDDAIRMLSEYYKKEKFNISKLLEKTELDILENGLNESFKKIDRSENSLLNLNQINVKKVTSDARNYEQILHNFFINDINNFKKNIEKGNIHEANKFLKQVLKNIDSCSYQLNLILENILKLEKKYFLENLFIPLKFSFEKYQQHSLPITINEHEYSTFINKLQSKDKEMVDKYYSKEPERKLNVSEINITIKKDLERIFKESNFKKQDELFNELKDFYELKNNYYFYCGKYDENELNKAWGILRKIGFKSGNMSNIDINTFEKKLDEVFYKCSSFINSRKIKIKKIISTEDNLFSDSLSNQKDTSNNLKIDNENIINNEKDKLKIDDKRTVNEDIFVEESKITPQLNQINFNTKEYIDSIYEKLINKFDNGNKQLLNELIKPTYELNEKCSNLTSLLNEKKDDLIIEDMKSIIHSTRQIENNIEEQTAKISELLSIKDLKEQILDIKSSISKIYKETDDKINKIKIDLKRELSSILQEFNYGEFLRKNNANKLNDDDKLRLILLERIDKTMREI